MFKVDVKGLSLEVAKNQLKRNRNITKRQQFQIVLKKKLTYNNEQKCEKNQQKRVKFSVFDMKGARQKILDLIGSLSSTSRFTHHFLTSVSYFSPVAS